MIPFEDLIADLGKHMGLILKPDSHESCRLLFNDGLIIQIDLTANADEILIGCELGVIHPGPYRDQIFKQALRTNGFAKVPQGIIAFSQKKEELILFQYLPLADYNGEKLNQFLQFFMKHARLWIDALKKGDIPTLEEDERSARLLASPFGLR